MFQEHSKDLHTSGNDLCNEKSTLSMYGLRSPRIPEAGCKITVHSKRGSSDSSRLVRSIREYDPITIGIRRHSSDDSPVIGPLEFFFSSEQKNRPSWIQNPLSPVVHPCVQLSRLLLFLFSSTSRSFAELGVD